jgi:hypothetical protein
VKTLLLIVSTSIVLLMCCNTPSKNDGKFHFSFIKNANIGALGSDIRTQEDSMVDAENLFIGKYGFADTIDFKLRKSRRSDTLDYFTRADSRYHRGVMPTDGLELFIDTSTTIINNATTYYPLYIVNETGYDKYFSHYNVIIEAEKEMQFYPIECNDYIVCGYGMFVTRIKPKEFVLMLIRKYKGNVKTQMRVSISSGGNIIKSLPYYGTINSGQFYSRHNFMFSQAPARAIQFYFNGAIPLEMDTGRY